MPPAGPPPPPAGEEPGGHRWVIGADGYVATFGFVPPGGLFAGALACLSLTRRGVELLAGPGAPLVCPWMGRLSAQSFEVLDRRIDLAGDGRLTLDEQGRPLHGLAVDPSRWQTDAPRVSTEADDSLQAATLVATADLAFGDAFPFDQRVRVNATVDAGGLEVRTIVETTRTHHSPVALGWHPYLRASGATPLRASGATQGSGGVELLLPFTVACELEELLPTGVERSVRPGWVRDPVIDEHWRATPGMQAVVRSDGLEVTLVFGRGFGWAMTWAPSRGCGFVCVEPMAAPLDPFAAGAPTPVVTPGAPWEGTFAIR